MLPRKYRKMPKDFKDFRKRFGWTLLNASDLINCIFQKKSSWISSFFHAKRDRRIAEQKAAQQILYAAKDYLGWFKKEPNKTHLFPLTATIFQYWFARGVRDGAGLKTRLRTIAAWRDYYHDDVASQAKKMKLSQGVVVHDFVVSEKTLESIAKATHTPKEDLIKSGMNFLPETTRKAFLHAYVPLPGKKFTEMSPLLISGKKIASSGKIDFSPALKTLSQKQIAFVKRAVYAAGVAAVRELLKEQVQGKPS